MKTRQSKWTESIAIGGDEFVAETKKQLGTGKIESEGEDFYLRESQAPFGLSVASDLQNGEQNSYEWGVFA